MSSGEYHTDPVQPRSHAFQDAIFDIIICGGGTAGCVLASRIASETAASVLLVEAGRDSGVAPDVLVPGKYVHQLSADLDGLWQLPTVPQKELNDRELIFLRGRQLGGSSAVNYMALARGPAADYDDWAKLVGDENWKWEHVLPLMKSLEDFDPLPPTGFDCYAQPQARDHGIGGPIRVGYGKVMTPGVATFINACKEAEIELCPDNNSGDPVGVGLAQFNTHDGLRYYAANAFLNHEKRQMLPNLTILTHTSTDRLLFEGDKVVGVELYDNSTGSHFQVRCRGEVILSAGTFGSPQILQLSGIGPRQHLDEVGVSCVVDSPGVGQNMLDHSILTIEYRVDDSLEAHNQIFSDPVLLAAADAQYEIDRTGPHSVYGTSGSVAFPKIQSLFESAEFAELDPNIQAFMMEPTRPSAEIWLGSGPSAFAGPVLQEHSYMTHELLLQNNLSKGSVTLKSKNPRDLPVIDPRFLEHPYDRRIAVETVRKAMDVGRSSAYCLAIQRMVHGPEATDDESILKFVRANLGQGYHSLGTCRMGHADDPKTVVDNQFRVVGRRGLRVADLSVCPILTCNHTQINVYLIAERCAALVAQDFNFGLVGISARL